MSSRQQDGESNFKSRPRANTTTFFPSWRRGKAEPAPPIPTVTPSHPLSLEALIEVLIPPAVPSLAHARSLAGLLATHTPLPRPAVLNPVLAVLCANDSPPAFQVAGFDIITAYWENIEATGLSTADRLSYFSLFLGSSTAWSSETWEPRFKALRALSSSGTDMIGMEIPLLDVLKSWIEGAFEGLFSNDLVDPAERAERERSIDALTASVTSVLANVEIIARIPEEDLVGVLQFYAEIVECALDLPSDFTTSSISSPLSPTDQSSSTVSSPSRPYSHRRHPSSLSVPTYTPQATLPLKHPVDLAITIYINHLTSQLKTLAPSHTTFILPLLFRALAFYASPLPRLSISAESQEGSPLENKITETLTSLFAGPFSTSCIIILKRHLYPPSGPIENMKAFMQVSAGAHRSFRNNIRRRLYSRIARAFINRESSVTSNHAGAPGHMDMERDLMERAWPKDEIQGWDADRLGRSICHSVEAWINWEIYSSIDGVDLAAGREKILDEAAGTLKDVFQEIDMREDDGAMDDEAANAVGETLYQLATYVLRVAKRNTDGTRFIIPLSQPTDAPTPFLRTLTSLLARDHTTYLNPLLSTTLLAVADHLADVDSAKLPSIMFDQHDLSPTSSEWLSNWKNLLGNAGLLSQSRPLTRMAVMHALEAVYESVKDMPAYRMPLAGLIFQFCKRQVAEDKEDSEGQVMWRILGEEVVLRTVEGLGEEGKESPENSTVEQLITLLITVAAGSDDDDDTASVYTVDSPSPHTSFPPGPYPSPTLSRMQSEYPKQEKDSNMPSVMAILSSLTTGNSSRAHSQHQNDNDDPPPDTSNLPPNDMPILPRSVGAVIALVGILSQLAFTPYALRKENLDVAVRVYDVFLALMVEAKSARARLAILQFMLRTRADRDHRVYFVDASYDPEGHIFLLASLIGRVTGGVAKESNKILPEEPLGDSEFIRKARTRLPQERDGRRASRGRGARVSHSASSRSRSRVPTQHLPRTVSTPALKPRDTIWQLPDILPFTVADVDTPSDGLLSYDPDRGEHEHVLQISNYLTVLVTLLDKEKNWEILSYLLCHLPVQLANKHLFCGPKCREVIAKLLTTLCAGLINGELASGVDRWPQGLKVRDAHGLAYRTVSVLISYRRCFDVRQQHLIVEVLQAGLNNGQPSTLKCCLHGLSLTAFELPSSTKSCLPRILQNLSEIMSNPQMAVHILSFLSIVGSLRELHSNFTEGDFKMVFGVALQYLQHNRAGSSHTISWALSQHLRILSYYIVYIWFLAVKLPDRPRHIPYITRQLLLANEGNEKVDEATEVCFDWLARYTYASADPRPANSLFSDIVMNPTNPGPSELAITEKTWIVGNSILTIRVLARLGWIEVLSRRPSGYTKFLCRVENVPMVGVGEVEPDMMSLPASLMMERGTAEAEAPVPRDMSEEIIAPATESHIPEEKVQDIFRTSSQADGTSRPHPFTGYVWSGTAPSQRRKHVAIDPSFLALHLSAYPKCSPENRTVVEPSLLPALFRTLDRMPVIDTHTVGIMYVAPGQTNEWEILRNAHGSPAYTRFLEGMGRLINLRGQVDVYAGGLDPDVDGEYAYAWWDDIGQFLFHTATMMPTRDNDPQCNAKKAHIGNDYVRIIWNDSGLPYKFETLKTQFQFVNIVIEPHSLGAIAAFSNNLHESEYFKVTVQRAPGMTDFTPIGDFKLISAAKLPYLVRQLSLLGDWFASIFRYTKRDTEQEEMPTNWRSRLQAIQRFRDRIHTPVIPDPAEGILAQEAYRDFTTSF